MSGLRQAIAPSRYPAPVWERFLHARHAAKPESAVSGCAELAAHHLRVCFHAGPEGLRFTAIACPTTIAVADYCAETLSRSVVSEWQLLDTQTILEALEIDDTHRHCVIVCEDAIRALLAQLSAPTFEDAPENR